MNGSPMKRRAGIVGLAALVLVGGVAVTTSSAADTAPKSSTVHCKADKQRCTTGKVTGPKGASGTVEVIDRDTATATLSAAFSPTTFNCTDRGYTATSAQFVFDIADFVAPAPGALVKSVTFTSPLAGGSTRAADYQVCFAAPYRFPALDLRPGQLTRDQRTGNFSDNTVPVADIGTGEPGFKGILPLCSANLTPNVAAGELHAPCLASRTVNLTAGTITVVVDVPAADPAMRA